MLTQNRFIKQTFLCLGGWWLLLFGSPSLTASTASLNNYLTDTLLIGVIDTFCLPANPSLDEVAELTEICDATQSELAFFKLIDLNCFTVLGLEPGWLQLCLVECDVNGLCDTTYWDILLIEEVLPEPMAQVDTLYLSEDAPGSLNILTNDQLNGLLDTLYIGIGPTLGSATIQNNGILTYSSTDQACETTYWDSLQYVLCNEYNCVRTWVYIQVECADLVVYNGFSPNGDCINEFFEVDGLEAYPEHLLRVYNRWGSLVYESSNYQNDWAGQWGSGVLPAGTYFYVLEYGVSGRKAGYLQLQR